LKEYKISYEIQEGLIKKITDTFFNNYLFIYNPLGNSIDVHKIYSLNFVLTIPMNNYKFYDFTFDEKYDSIYILVKNEKSKTNNKVEKNDMIIIHI
jgi:hypothetical protein